MPIKGAKNRKPIEAIEELDTLKSFLKALKPVPYFEAWVSFAILASPRFGEQKRLTLDDVSLVNKTVKLVGKKTGNTRRNPIERTTLLPILTKWIAFRKQQQEAKGATEAEKSNLVFPSMSSTSVQWRNNTFFKYWSKAVAKVGSKQASSAAKAWLVTYTEQRRLAKRGEIEAVVCPLWVSSDCWRFGPDEWRHCAGTMLAHCGFTSLEISSFMGNSPTVAIKHYIASVGKSGNTWGFKFAD